METDRHQCEGGVDRLGQGHIDAPQNLQGAGTFHACRLVQLLGNAHEGLAQQEDGKGRCEVRQADGQQRIDQAQPGHGLVVFHQQDVRHDHQLHQHQRKRNVLAPEVIARKGERRQGGQHQLRKQDDGDEQRGVQKIACKRRGLPGVAEVLQGPRRCQIEAGGVFAGVESRPHRIGQRQDPAQGQQPGGQRVEPGVAVDHRRCVGAVHL